MIHLNGMGLVGCLLAIRLEDEGIPFTWYDKQFGDSFEDVKPAPKINSWKASTGCCYPSDDPLDVANYRRFASAEVVGHHWLKNFVTTATYGYGATNPPHYNNKKKAEHLCSTGTISFLKAPSYHLNVQALVVFTRIRLAARFAKEAAEGYKVVNSHGFHEKCPTRYFWGWSTHAQLTLSDKLKAEVGETVCLNLQHKRYGTWYAYPVPRTEGALDLQMPEHTYYLGTAFIHQKVPKELEIPGKFGKFMQHLLDKCGKDIVVHEPEAGYEFKQGWRPQCYVENQPLVWEEDGEFWVRPQYASAWRHHLTLWEEFRAVCKC